MEKPVSGDLFSERKRVFEDACPVFNLLEVRVDVLAVSEGVWKVPDNLAEIRGTLDKMTSFDISKDSLGVSHENISSAVAFFDFSEMVVAGEAEHKSSDEVWDSERVKFDG